MKYDYLVVGAGLFGSVFAHEMHRRGKSVLVIDKLDHVGGHCYTKEMDGIHVHWYGPHIFHTSSKEIWEYMNQFAEFHPYRHQGKAYYRGTMYSLPFNMMTYHQLWGCVTPAEAQEILAKQRVPIASPSNLEEWCLSQVGPEIYQKLIYGYTKKQWRREPKLLPSQIIRRLPLRFTYNDNYYNDIYQGVPAIGYTAMVQNMLADIPVELKVDFFEMSVPWNELAHKLVYSGPIDQFFNYQHGQLEYLTLRFDHRRVEGDFQGSACINYTEEQIPFTRITEHKHFLGQSFSHSMITYEYPEDWKAGSEPYYPINDDRNSTIYAKYRELQTTQENVIIGGRLGSYKYYDMDQIVAQAIHTVKQEVACMT